MMALEARAAASRTWSDGSEKQRMRSGRITMMYGSNSSFRRSHRHSNANSAPCDKNPNK
jgi:hypothetical protein